MRGRLLLWALVWLYASAIIGALALALRIWGHP